VLGEELGLAGYYQRDYGRLEPRDFLLLRSFGIPGLGVLYGSKVHPIILPTIALSPDDQMLAGSYLGDTVRLRAPANGGSKEITLATSRLDVFRVADGQRLWTTQVRPRARPVARTGGPMVNPAVLPWISPDFADVRWSRDGHYLSFSILDDPARKCHGDGCRDVEASRAHRKGIEWFRDLPVRAMYVVRF